MTGILETLISSMGNAELSCGSNDSELNGDIRTISLPLNKVFCRNVYAPT